MSRRFGSLIWLQDDEARSEADGSARIIQAISGGAVYLHELLSGQPASDDGAATPPNPQGELGVDLSGPPWGSAVRHPIAWLGGKKPDAALGTGFGGSILAIEGSATVGLSVYASLGPWAVWVRPHERLPSPSVAPYSLGVLDMRGHNNVATATTLTIGVRNFAMDGGEGGLIYDGTRTITTAASVAESTWTPTEGDAFVPLVSGLNVIEIGFKINDVAVTSLLDSIIINQIQKRTH